MHRRSTPHLITGIIVVLIFGAAVMLFLNRNKQIVSPVPPKPSLEIIFYTPTPELPSPTSSPSATPRVSPTRPAARSTAKPTSTPPAATPTGKSVTMTPAGGTVTPTSKATPSTTPKPTGN